MLNNGEKKSPPKFNEKWKDCFIHVAIKMIEGLSGQDVSICIKQEALDIFPDIDKPIFVYDKGKEHWMALNPKKEEKILTPRRKVYDPSKN